MKPCSCCPHDVLLVKHTLLALRRILGCGREEPYSLQDHVQKNLVCCQVEKFLGTISTVPGPRFVLHQFKSVLIKHPLSFH